MQIALGNSDTLFFTSLKPTDHESKLLIFRASQSQDHEIGEFDGRELRVTDVLISPAVKVDAKTGEEIQLIRIALVTDDKRVVVGFGKGLRKSMTILESVFGAPPWKPALSLTVTMVSCVTGKMPILEPFVPKDSKVERRK